MSQHDRDVDIESREKKSDSSKVASTLIKYVTYLIIFFGILWFLINYILPML
ncbi:hypothetical protein G4V62_15590 [Bacillaceae bacterium SIJ1]|uniref:hypothetical protein n=1 Tax=Litoribacterium kuwaitense TaxID=1398745 RepID=UPI0013EC864E|nr:hypothetical protein [Litoribacterium kuwaitense]NGP46297.1 hypothetical protein [Litoribacterium kuwaitense]